MTLELWGGVECTVNRVGDTYFDQLRFSGHWDRPSDLDQIAGLGLRTLRYPVLWEHVAPESLDRPDWTWPDARLNRLRELGVRPIAGLLHHGSGPLDTNLLDPAFPEKLAVYAGMVARRYPWIDAYTPINEPLTTARFSGLYGHWYPHGRSTTAFIRTLLNQCRGIILAMKAVREINPAAQLVQTEDLGRAMSTPQLAYQADFENERRFLSLDLLCGKVDERHPLARFLAEAGATGPELDFFRTHALPPDIIGINHYVTSNRYLDEAVDRYPPEHLGGNGRHRYADVECARVGAARPADWASLLKETWERYGRPVAVTESHIHPGREEQMRWLRSAWDAATALRREGVDVRAVTVWSLYGAFDWDSLVTRREGYYEPGAFDVRSSPPRPTALAGMVQALATGEDPIPPLTAMPGWWERPSRSLYPPANEAQRRQETSFLHGRAEELGAAPLVIVGGGTLGQAFARICQERAIPHALLERKQMDICDPRRTAAVLDRMKPWAVVNAAGYVEVDEAEKEWERCYRENAVGPSLLGEACSQRNLLLLTFSSDMVFDGRANRPYTESSPVHPLNAYGRSKAMAEALLSAGCPDALVIRTSAFFGPWDEYNFLTIQLRRLAEGLPVSAPRDVMISPTYVPALVNTSLDLLLDGEKGIWHLVNDGATTWADFARTGARMAGLDPGLVRDCSADEMGWAAERPTYSVLGSEHARLLPSLQNAMARYMSEMGAWSGVPA